MQTTMTLAPYQVTPLVVQDMMYICTPFGTVIALDPVSGQERWRFDPQLQQPPTQTTQHMTCRGVSYFDATRVAPFSGLPLWLHGDPARPLRRGRTGIRTYPPERRRNPASR